MRIGRYGLVKLNYQTIKNVFIPTKAQFVDRSLVNARFNLDRDVGVQIYHMGNIGNIKLKEAFAISLSNGRNVIIDDKMGINIQLE